MLMINSVGQLLLFNHATLKKSPPFLPTPSAHSPQLPAFRSIPLQWQPVFLHVPVIALDHQHILSCL